MIIIMRESSNAGDNEGSISSLCMKLKRSLKDSPELLASWFQTFFKISLPQ